MGYGNNNDSYVNNGIYRNNETYIKNKNGILRMQ
jgi:hypothetical protein